MAHHVVIRVWDVDELHASFAQVSDAGDDVGGEEGDVLHAGAVVEVDEFFDLRFVNPGGWLVDGYFDGFVGGGHYG